MKKSFNAIFLFMRYLVNISAFSTALFYRAGIGTNLYAPFTVKPYGKGEGYYDAPVMVRLWFIVLLYIWMRLFFILSFVNDTAYFDANDWGAWQAIFTGFYTMSFFKNDIYPPVSGVFFVLSYLVPIVAIIQLVVAYELVPKLKRPDKTSLGFSLIFGWFDKSKDRKGHYLIWGFLEPLLMGLIGAGLHYFSFPILSLFFLLSGAGLAIQGQAMRLKYRREREHFVTTLENSDQTKALEKEVGATKRREAAKALQLPDAQEEDFATF